MGNSSSTGVTWNIILDHERPGHNLAFVAGNVLKGKVIAKVEKTLPPTKLELQLTGKEKSHTRKGSGKNSRHRYGQRVIASARVVLREANEEIFPGTYSFPFHIKLPESLPTSVSIESYKGTYYRIQYKLELFKKNVKRLSNRKFVMAAIPLPDERVPVMVEPAAHRVESFGFNKGSLLLGAKVRDTHVGRGTDLEVCLATRNEATATIHRVEVKLVEKAEWNAGSDRNYEKRVLAQLTDVDLPGIMRGKQEKEVVKDMIRSGTDSEQLSGLYHDLVSGENKVLLKVPYGAKDSHDGGLGKISHYLEITMFTKSLVSNPTVKIPLRIGFPPRLAIHQVEVEEQQAVGVSPRQAIDQVDVEQRPVLARPSSIVAVDPTDMPIPEAVPISIDDVVDAPMASVVPEAFVLGGSAVYAEEGNGFGEPSMRPSAPLASEISQQQQEPSIAALLAEMLLSIKDYDIISSKLHDQAWENLLASISAEEFGSIIGHVNVDIDQHRVAQLLAPHIGSTFTCDYCITAIKSSSELYKTTMVERLLPYCVDIKTNHASIRAELSDWEQTVTSVDFDRAINAR